MSSPWASGQRVSRTRPCPVCGSTDWCGFSSDGRFVFCQRMDSWNGKLAIRQNDAGAMFAFSERQSRESRRQSPPRSAIPRPPSLSHELLNHIYRELAQRTGLDDTARYDLITRRRFPTALETGIYFSLPRAGRENEELSEALIDAFGLDVIERVPGFTFLCRRCDGSGTIEDRACTDCASLGKQRPRFRSVRGGRHDYGLIGCDASGLGFWGYSRRLPFDPQRNKGKYLLFSSGRAGEPGLAIAQDPEFLWRRPVLATGDGTVYAGNMRLRAAQHLGHETIPAILDDISEQLAKERALRDNAQWGEWREGTAARH